MSSNGAVRIVMVGEHRFRLPFLDLIPFDEQQNAELGQAIKDDGAVIVPVVCWKERKSSNEDTVIDGAHRVIWAAEHGLTRVPIDRRSYADEQAAKDTCERLNEKRRHLTLEQLHCRREERVKRVEEARGRGESIRSIAGKEGVSKAQIERDLAGVPGGTPEPTEPVGESTPDDSSSQNGEPETVIGRDGKTYPKSRPKPSKKEQPQDEIPKDHFGNELPKRCRAPFCDPWLQDTYDALTTFSEQFRKQRIGDGIRKRAKHYPFFNAKDVADGAAFVIQYLDSLIDHFKDHRPAGVCPSCNGKGCPECRMSGLVSRELYKQLKEKAR